MHGFCCIFDTVLSAFAKFEFINDILQGGGVFKNGHVWCRLCFFVLSGGDHPVPMSGVQYNSVTLIRETSVGNIASRWFFFFRIYPCVHP